MGRGKFRGIGGAPQPMCRHCLMPCPSIRAAPSGPWPGASSKAPRLYAAVDRLTLRANLSRRSMARIAVSPALKASAAKRWVTALALLAFLLQSLVIQTHIHQPAPTLSVKAASLHLPAPLKAPDPIDQCRFCQELVQAGAFVAPPATAVSASLILVAAIFAALPAFTGASARAFAWQSRAPPR
jgi:hypothetical protein